MYPRIEYKMSEKDLKIILDACKPTPVMFVSGGTSIGGSQQENSNRAWETLGDKMGFDSMTVQLIPGKGNEFFTAVPSETKEQKIDREKKEKLKENQRRAIQLRKEITERQTKLKELENKGE